MKTDTELTQAFAKLMETHGSRVIGSAQHSNLRSPDIVHHVAYVSGVYEGFQLLCDAPYLVVHSMYHARVASEVGLDDHVVALSPTLDPVDCMTCLVAYGR